MEVVGYVYDYDCMPTHCVLHFKYLSIYKGSLPGLPTRNIIQVYYCIFRPSQYCDFKSGSIETALVLLIFGLIITYIMNKKEHSIPFYTCEFDKSSMIGINNKKVVIIQNP